MCGLLLTAMFLTTGCNNEPEIAVTGINLNKITLTLAIGESEILVATVIPNNATDKAVTWESNNPSIATVDADGKVTAVSEGTVTIIARAGNRTAECVVTIRGINIDGVVWATRNVNTHGTFVENPQDFGGLFQWGRRGDGHEQRNSPTTTELSTSDVPGHGNFIITSWDWRNPSNDNLWANPKTANDPCPQGWRVPTDAELLTLVADNVTSEWTTVNDVSGRIFTDINTNNAFFLPAAGWRDTSGTLLSAGTLGYYWSSSPTAGTSARYLLFNSASLNVVINGRVRGFSVRCVAE